MGSAFIYSEKLSGFKLSENHPYDPVRGRRVFEMCNKYGLLSGQGMEVKEPGPASLEELSEVHNPIYLDLLQRAAQGEYYLGMLEYGIGTEDCPVFAGLIDFITLATGATVAAMQALDKGTRFAFNPVGGFHHAGRSTAEGFCYVNDLALVATRWANQGKRVMVVDIDAHHGNGTQDYFYADPRVLTMSFHESGETLYPWGGGVEEIGEAEGKGYNVNVPLPENSDDEIFTFAFTEVFPPVLKAFQPDAVIGVMGVDTFSTDPLTHLKMTNNSYAEAAGVMDRLAPCWMALGAGGYDLDNVARGWTLMWAKVNGLDRDDDAGAVLGGSFLAESDLGIASLRDMAVRTSGPEKAKALEKVEASLEHIKENVFPLLQT